MALPAGVVTFLFTDVEGSTRHWEESPESMLEAIRQHDEAIERSAETHRGIPVRPRGEGDSRFVVFASASDAVAASAEMQRLLARIDWVTPRPLLVRIALHTGEADLQLGDYYGAAVNRAARLRAIAHGGQSVMSGATRELVQDDLPPGVTIRDLGEHVLKDLTRPEHVYQIDAEGLRDSFPPLASLNAIPNNLPIQPTEFVGRRGELDQAGHILGGSRLLTILAPGGAGKTRTAIQLAADVSVDFPDGVFFVDLTAIEMAGDITQAIAESIGIALSTGDDLETQLLTYLAGKRQLLLFDNFEHVIDGAQIVGAILNGAPRVKVIATSRSKLNIIGETVMVLGGLETSWETADEALRTDSVQLFVDTAKRSDASFSLAGDDLEPLGQILRDVAGMPLGIELAAVWVDVLSVGEIATEITKSLDFLETEAGGVPDRHRSIRAVFDYSWAMLSEAERRTFSALSVLRGGFTRKAAESVAGASIRDLATLAGKSLLVADRDGGRYTIPELLRQYAEAALRDDVASWEATMAAHARFYAELTAGAEQLIPLSDQRQALRIVEDDLDNIRSGLRHSLGSRDAVAVRKYLIGLWFLHEIRGWHQAAIGLYDEVLHAFPTESSDDAAEIVRWTAVALEAWFVALLGRPEDAAERAAEAVDRLAPLPDLFAHLMAIQSRCGALNYLNRWEEVRAATIEGEEIADGAGEEWWAAQMRVWRPLAELRLGADVDSAIGMLDEALVVLARRGDYRVRSWALLAKAAFQLVKGQSIHAIETFRSVVEAAEEIGYRRMIQAGLQFLGDAQRGVGELNAAEAAYLESFAVSEQMGAAVEMAGNLVGVAHVRADMGDAEEAVAILASVLADPVSSRSTRVGDMPVGDAAAALLTELEESLDPAAYASAHARGGTRSLESTAKELQSGPA